MEISTAPMGNLPILIEGTPKWFNGLCKNLPGMASGKIWKKKGGEAVILEGNRRASK